MFSLDNFYYVLYTNFLQASESLDIWFNEFGKVSLNDINIGTFARHGWRAQAEKAALVLFYDQEPLVPQVFDSTIIELIRNVPNILSAKATKILANSEHSKFKTDFCREYKFYDWYYFFHGLAALEWYRDYKYIPKVDNKFTKVFITLNHLVSEDRSYRLNLVANLLERNLVQHGYISCQLEDKLGSWKDEILRPHSNLSKKAKQTIYKQFRHLSEPMVLDQDGWRGDSSAKINLPLLQSGLWNVVTETVFYYDKLHLTEKMFKPIVARRPFILVGAPGNLEYFKSYGFKTFDKWIDEGYDNEPDHDLRIAMIVDQIERLCKLGHEELDIMHQEMQEVLDYNFNHFYGDFKHMVISEMVLGYEKCLKQMNVGCLPEKRVDTNWFGANSIIKRLCQ